VKLIRSVDQFHLDAFDGNRRDDGKEDRGPDAEQQEGDQDAPFQGISSAHRGAS
jgi:hypothetical protein